MASCLIILIPIAKLDRPGDIVTYKACLGYSFTTVKRIQNLPNRPALHVLELCVIIYSLK